MVLNSLRDDNLPARKPKIIKGVTRDPKPKNNPIPVPIKGDFSKTAIAKRAKRGGQGLSPITKPVK